MLDPYQDDDDMISCRTGFLGGEEGNKPFFKAFEQVGKTIRDGGFCKPNGQHTSPRKSSGDDTEADAESDDSVRKVKTVTFDDNVEIEPLILEDDLVMNEDGVDEHRLQAVEKEETFAPTAMPLTTFLITTLVVAVLVSHFCPQCLSPVADFLNGIKDSPIVKGLFLLIAIKSAAEMFLSSNSQLGGFVELCWSLFVLLIICTGVKYTYDLEWAKITVEV